MEGQPPKKGCEMGPRYVYCIYIYINAPFYLMFCTTPFQPRKSRGEGSKASVQIRRLALVEMVSMPTIKANP